MPRIQLKGQRAVYHCMSRIVGGAYLLGKLEKEMFVKQLLKLSEFCGIELLGYCIMSNHYHVLIRVPKAIELTDEEMLEKLKNYYGKKSPKYRAFAKKLETGDEQLVELRAKYLRMMGDLPEFQKLLKQRFSVWYNKRMGRKGTLWMERYKSVLVEDTIYARLSVSAYINLNPVRASMKEDPAEYRYSDYGRSVVGDLRAREGMKRMSEEGSWESVQRVYRPFLLARGMVDSKGNNQTVKESLLREAESLGGKLPMAKLLRLRVRYFSDGLVLGGEEFVEGVYEKYRKNFGKRRRKGSRKLRGGDWGNLRVIRDLRNNVFG